MNQQLPHNKQFASHWNHDFASIAFGKHAHSSQSLCRRQKSAWA